ncbi:MAG TPA: cupredoxin family copper-binding protein [Candidatus Cybelea sp.]|jgi:plastocyanin|nr:cupredoxin family copper-binding protein [Candidatus Cybelea sp.]
MKHIVLLALAALLIFPAAAGSAVPSVFIKNDAFSPQTLTVTAGESVTFTNDDDDAHTVTASDGTFDSKGLDTNGAWRHTFSKPGRYGYFCELHPFMQGTIVVKAAMR